MMPQILPADPFEFPRIPIVLLPYDTDEMGGGEDEDEEEDEDEDEEEEEEDE